MQRSFDSLSPQEVLQVAISIEERNAELYHNFAEMFTELGDKESLEISSVFWEMAVEERNHAWQLRQRYAELYGEQVCAVNEQELAEIIELPRLDNNVLDSPNEGSGRARALAIALQAEISAQGFYARLAASTPAGPLHDVFSYLAQMEDGHVAYLQSKLVQHQKAASIVH